MPGHTPAAACAPVRLRRSKSPASEGDLPTKLSDNDCDGHCDPQSYLVQLYWLRSKKSVAPSCLTSFLIEKVVAPTR